MTFDAPRAKAELEQVAILVQHHVRQAQIAKDVETLRIFSKRLYDLKETAENARRSFPRTCECGKVIELRHIKICPKCGRDL